jgi:hypothetical protein
MREGGVRHDVHADDRGPTDNPVRIRRRPAQGGKEPQKDEDAFVPEQLNELGEEGWEAVGLSLKYEDLMAWPVVLLKRPIR